MESEDNKMHSKEIQALILDVDVDSSFNSECTCNLPILDVHAIYQHDESKSNPIQPNTFSWFFMEKYMGFIYLLDFEI